MDNLKFQTPEWVCEIMVNLIDGNPTFILEPTPGVGNIVKALKIKFPDSEIDAPVDFYKHIKYYYGRYHYVVANPPFTPMKIGYEMLDNFFKLTDNIIILMPWLALINSEKRTEKYISNGLKKIIHLPRYAFPGTRVQTCILVFEKGYKGNIIFEYIKAPLK